MTEFEKASEELNGGGTREWGLSDQITREVPLVRSEAQFRSTAPISRRVNGIIERAVDIGALNRLRELRRQK